MSRVQPDPPAPDRSEPAAAGGPDPTRLDPAPVVIVTTAPAVLGGYRVEKMLGQGGMGAVYLARDDKLDRAVALKTMKPAAAAEPGAVERFLREARAAAKVSHDNVIAILHVGEDAGTPFIAMPLLEGEPLNELLRRDRVPPLGVVLKVGREAADGLAAAHAKGLVHRDIKPANIWVEGDARSPDWAVRFRRVKVLDFGLARPTTDDTHLTGTGFVVGTPAYMSPEQARAHPLDGRTDVFSLGVVLYQMLTGALPFDGGTYTAVLTSLAVDTPPPPAERNPQVPVEVSALVMRMLTKSRDRRPTAAEVSAGLRAIGQRLAAGPPPTVVAYVPPPAPVDDNPFTELDASSVTVPPRAEPPAERPRRPRGAGLWATAALASLVAVALVGAAVSKLVRPGRTPAEPPRTEERVTPLPPPPQSKDQNREVARWAITSLGAEVHVRVADQLGRNVRAEADLPVGPFQVTSLVLPWDRHRVTDDDLARLEGLTGLEILTLNNSAVTGAGMARVARLKRLTVLHAANTRIGNDGLEHLKGSKALEALVLPGTRIDDTGLRHLKGLTALRELDVSGTAVNGSGFAQLDTLAALSLLDASRTGVNDDALAHIARLPALTDLLLASTGPYTPDGLARLKGLANLRRLNLSGTGLTGPTVAALRGLPGLTTLVLEGAELTDADVRELAGLPNLERLSLAGQSKVSTLAPLSGLARLTFVDARGTKVAAADAESFRAGLAGRAVELDAPKK